MPGFIFTLVIMIPNIVFVAKHPERFKNLWQNRLVEIIEQAGRYGCIAFMVLNIPGTCRGFPSKEFFMAYIITNTIISVIYCVAWLCLFQNESIKRAVILSVLPAAMFLVSAVAIRSIPLVICATMFAPCHITISYKNARLSIKEGRTTRNEP